MKHIPLIHHFIILSNSKVAGLHANVERSTTGSARKNKSASALLDDLPSPLTVYMIVKYKRNCLSSFRPHGNTGRENPAS